MTQSTHGSKTKLLEAARTVIRAKGYTATTVDDICAAAGLTKGSFFHHFESKDELGVAAADYWTETTGAFFHDAPYHAHADPLARVLGYIDFRKSLLRGAIADYSCLVGTMVQETYDTHPAIRDACGRSISGHAATLEADIAAAMRQRGLKVDWTAEKSRSSNASRHSRRVHCRQGDRLHGGGGGIARSFASLFRVAV